MDEDFVRRSSPSTVVVVVGRRLRRSSPSSVVRHFPFSSKGGTFEKNQIFAVFQKTSIFLKFKIFGKMSGRDFLAVAGSSPSTVVVVVGRCLRRSSPSSVVRHFPFSSKGGTFEKNQIFSVFQKTLNFSQIQDFRQNEWTNILSPSPVVAVDGRRRRRSLPSSVVAVVRRPSFPFFVQGRDL